MSSPQGLYVKKPACFRVVLELSGLLIQSFCGVWPGAVGTYSEIC